MNVNILENKNYFRFFEKKYNKYNNYENFINSEIGALSGKKLNKAVKVVDN